MNRRGFLGMALCLLLTGCTLAGRQAADIAAVPVDAGAALAAVNAYRAAHGEAALVLDPRLNLAAGEMARLMARQDNSKPRAHDAARLFGRLNAVGLESYAGAENIGSGYLSFAAAFTGWKGSPGHNRNLLNPHVTRVGFARARRADGKWRNFWVMILARPVEDGRPVVSG